MTHKTMEKRRPQVNDELEKENFPLCREPWENFYILRRGILPCCYGNPIPYSMNEWVEAWNSSDLQEIRHYLSRGELSPYCLECLGCPIVQRQLSKKGFPHQRPFLLRLINRMFFRLPGKTYRAFGRKR